jgi:hypothetical protein
MGIGRFSTQTVAGKIYDSDEGPAARKRRSEERGEEWEQREEGAGKRMRPRFYPYLPLVTGEAFA